MALSLIGSTIPEVPKIDSPPTIPSLGLNVRAATSAPPGMEITTSIPPLYPSAVHTVRTCSSIMARGTWLIAAAPTGWSSPAFVTRPTPSPPSIKIPPVVRRRTAAQTSMPSVTSLSSPASLVTAQRAAAPSSNTIASTRDAVTVTPLGVVSVTATPTWPVSSSRAAPAAAKAAQVPVV